MYILYFHRSVLEEQRSALEKDYEERIKSIKKELERISEEEKAQVKQELEEVNKWSLITGENDSDGDDNNPAHCQVYSDPCIQCHAKCCLCSDYPTIIQHRRSDWRRI